MRNMNTWTSHLMIILSLGSVSVSAVSPNDYKSSSLFSEIGAVMKTNGESLVKEVNGIFAFRVFHKEWPGTLDKDGEEVEEATW